MLLMMGSAEELPQAPSEKPRFLEDMSEAEAAAAVSVWVGGLGITGHMFSQLNAFHLITCLQPALHSQPLTRNGESCLMPVHG